jgi:hypothetical protein
MILVISGLFLIGVAAILDSVLRTRMSRVGHSWALFEGGAFNYSKYYQEAKQRGWSLWPVYMMWVAAISGITLLIVGFFALFGTSPTRRQ